MKESVPLIEFLKGRIYLTHAASPPKSTATHVFLSVENVLLYNPFHLDFGPLHLGHLYRFAVILHNTLNDEQNEGKAVVICLSSSARARANTACLLCCYLVLLQLWSPHQVLQPIAQMDPPVMPFRDAGYLNADFEICIQDVVYALWRAKERGLVDLQKFDLEEYENYEQVDQGDLNLIYKDFVAFASPQQSKPAPFKKVLSFFKKHNVKLVVRLNSHLYDAREFTKRGIEHIDMIFDDGTCPTLETVQKFIGISEGVIAKGGKVAVHCKAGLGRTGCLIGAHLIYTHGFTANECIAYMRLIRPGMVVGPQQHWLYLHQGEFRDWRFTMCLDPVADANGHRGLVPIEAVRERRIRVTKRRVSGRMKRSLRSAVPVGIVGQPRKGLGGRYVTGANSDDEYEDLGKENQEK